MQRPTVALHILLPRLEAGIRRQGSHRRRRTPARGVVVQCSRSQGGMGSCPTTCRLPFRRLEGGLPAAGHQPKRTRPYRPQTNGNIERIHRTLTQKRAYARHPPIARLTNLSDQYT